MAIRIPVVFSLMMASIVYVIFLGDIPLTLLSHRMSGSLQSFPLLALPLYILAAEIMNQSKISQQIFNFAKLALGHISGALGHVNVVVSMIFAGMSGSITADTAGLGSVEIPAMIDAGYDKKFSVGITGASSLIGPIIPPSIHMIIYGMIAEQSVGQLFLGGAIPGTIMGITLMIMVYLISLKKELPKSPKMSPFSLIWGSFKKAFPAVLTPIIILGGIVTGIFTPTEAAVVAVIYSYLLGFVIYRTLKISDVFPMLVNVACTTAIILAIMGAASVFGWVITLENIPNQIRDIVIGFTDKAWVVMLLLIVAFTIAGCFFDIGAILLVITPMVVPLVKAYGIDLIHFGILEVLVLCIGFLTPPFGVGLFILSNIAKIPVHEVIRAMLPFYIPLYFMVFLIMCFPSIVLFLPNYVMR
jgi:tripartite ATP-independent transporter DctM subunit